MAERLSEAERNEAEQIAFATVRLFDADAKVIVRVDAAQDARVTEADLNLLARAYLDSFARVEALEKDVTLYCLTYHNADDHPDAFASCRRAPCAVFRAALTASRGR